MEERPKRVLFFGSDSVGGPSKHKVYIDLLMGTSYSESDSNLGSETKNPDEIRKEDQIVGEEGQ